MVIRLPVTGQWKGFRRSVMNSTSRASRAWLLPLAALSVTWGLSSVRGNERRRSAAAETAATAPPVVHYRTATVAGTEMFYREAGPSDAPIVLLLHGFPTSSHMFRNLIPALADRYHVIAPDYPGYGQSAAPDFKKFSYTFAKFTDLVDGLLEKLGAREYAMYVMDYGAPVGYRLALKHPERVTALIVQNGNAYEEGLKEFWDPIKAYWSDGSMAHREAINNLMDPATTKFQYVDGVKDVSRIDPDNWAHDQALLDRPGNRDIQLDLFYDYRTNVPLYPQFQAFFRTHKPPVLIVWGKNDKIFPADGAYPYMKDLPHAEFHLIDTGHFALEDKADEMVPLIRDFLDRKIGRE
jgi:pimeloyl-ACP methyl ester carboxylesterase